MSKEEDLDEGKEEMASLTAEELDDLAKIAFEVLIEPTSKGTGWIVDTAACVNREALAAATMILRARYHGKFCEPFVLARVIAQLKAHEAAVKSTLERLEAASLTLEEWRKRSSEQ